MRNLSLGRRNFHWCLSHAMAVSSNKMTHAFRARLNSATSHGASQMPQLLFLRGCTLNPKPLNPKPRLWRTPTKLRSPSRDHLPQPETPPYGLISNIPEKQPWLLEDMLTITGAGVPIFLGEGDCLQPHAKWRCPVFVTGSQ